ncbi:MAG: hypothetical protein LH615_11815, partial [Ferruginibacter sp.]|nr:hypothetical protein [Ferruginibacter sp.]
MKFFSPILKNNMKKIFVLIPLLFIAIFSFAQQADKIINAKELLRIESFLASDEMRGRKTGTPEIDKAADFIAAEFKNYGLKPFGALSTFKQSFTNVRTKFLSAKAVVDSSTIEENNIIAISTDSLIKITEQSGYTKVVIGNLENLLLRAEEIINAKQNQIVLVNSFFV